MILGLIAWLVAVVSSSFKERKLIESGVLPAPENTTDVDISRLAQSGYKIWAIKRYRQLHKVSLKEAKQKIEAL